MKQQQQKSSKEFLLVFSLEAAKTHKHHVKKQSCGRCHAFTLGLISPTTGISSGLSHIPVISFQRKGNKELAWHWVVVLLPHVFDCVWGPGASTWPRSKGKPTKLCWVAEVTSVELRSGCLNRMGLTIPQHTWCNAAEQENQNSSFFFCHLTYLITLRTLS